MGVLSQWQTLPPRDKYAGKTVHSILFEDGSVWDAVNGWRPEGMFYMPRPGVDRHL